MTERPSFCQYCGNPLTHEALYCAKCGKQVVEIDISNVAPPSLKQPPSLQPNTHPKFRHDNSKHEIKSSTNWNKVIAFSLVGVVVLLVVIVFSLLIQKSAQNRMSVFPTTEPIMTPTLIIPTPTIEIITETPADLPTVAAEDFSTAADVPTDWDQLAKDILRVDFSQSDCTYSPTGDYYFYGSVTNISDKYSVENVWLRGELYSSSGNLLMMDKKLPDAIVISPGTKANFWLWVSYRQVANPICKVVVESASIAP